MNTPKTNIEEIEEIDVAHICLFEEETGKVLIQHNKKFEKSAFVGGKCDGKSKINTILDEMSDEIGFALLPEYFIKVTEDTKIVGGKKCNGTIFVGYLPKGFIPVDIIGEGKSNFYDLDNAPLDDFITGESRIEIMEKISQCKTMLDFGTIVDNILDK